MPTWITWLESSWLNAVVTAIPWGFPIAEALHFVGLAILIGALALIDLRMLGFARGMPVKAFHQLLPWAWYGFALNAITGIYFFLTQPSFYYPNVAFRVKLILIALAGANALWFELSVKRKLDSWSDDADLPSQAKLMASSSLVLWVAVICFGRFIMYWPPI